MFGAGAVSVVTAAGAVFHDTVHTCVPHHLRLGLGTNVQELMRQGSFTGGIQLLLLLLLDSIFI